MCLQIAGHKLFLSFKRQQEKVFAYVRREFVAELARQQEKGGDNGAEDIDAVKSRIEKYVDNRLYSQPPEGSYIPETDDSQHIRC